MTTQPIRFAVPHRLPRWLGRIVCMFRQHRWLANEEKDWAICKCCRRQWWYTEDDKGTLSFHEQP